MLPGQWRILGAQRASKSSQYYAATRQIYSSTLAAEQPANFPDVLVRDDALAICRNWHRGPELNRVQLGVDASRESQADSLLSLATNAARDQQGELPCFSAICALAPAAPQLHGC